MKNFEINCKIKDKENPSNMEENIININLITTIQAEDAQSAIQQLSTIYQLIEIISIQEIL